MTNPKPYKPDQATIEGMLRLINKDDVMITTGSPRAAKYLFDKGLLQKKSVYIGKEKLTYYKPAESKTDDSVVEPMIVNNGELIPANAGPITDAPKNTWLRLPDWTKTKLFKLVVICVTAALFIAVMYNLAILAIALGLHYRIFA